MAIATRQLLTASFHKKQINPGLQSYKSEQCINRSTKRLHHNPFVVVLKVLLFLCLELRLLVSISCGSLLGKSQKPTQGTKIGHFEVTDMQIRGGGSRPDMCPGLKANEIQHVVLMISITKCPLW